MFVPLKMALKVLRITHRTRFRIMKVSCHSWVSRTARTIMPM